MNKDSRGITLKNVNHILLGDLCLALHDNLITLDRYNLTRILIHEVFIPTLQHAGSQTLANVLLEIGLVNLYLVGEFEYLENVFVGLKTNSTQKSSYGQLLLTVDICIHDIVDVGCELDP